MIWDKIILVVVFFLYSIVLMKQKYLFFYLMTGGGHASTAKAVEKYFQKNHSDTIDVVLVDWFKNFDSIVKNIVLDGYAQAQSKSYAKLAYEFLYLINKSYLGAKISQLTLSISLMSHLKKLIQQERPDKIVVFHFFLIRPLLKILKILKLNIPIITVVTDPFTTSRLRFLEKNMEYMVYSDSMKAYALENWIPENNITVFPAIIDEKFATKISPMETENIKKRLWFLLDKKVILLLWSGDWFPKGELFLKHLSKINIDAYIAIVCWRNIRLLAAAEKIQKENPHLHLKIYGFIDFVYDLINISDVVVTKWWPAGIFEILMLDKIPLIHTYMWEQEKWNVEFIVQNNVGVYQKDIKKLIEFMKELFNWNDSVYQKNIKKLELRIGTSEIAEHIRKI